ncbi:MAG: SDR family oxidoreductase [Solirubrobacterales bacterium]|nr:SDR family oxidoreductase [Solirubrobacterales bacterium]
MSEASGESRFEGKVTLVTGGASGIGEATSRRLASEGATVVVVDLDADLGQALADSVDRIEYERVDVTDGEQVAALMDGIVSRHGRLDGVHANAGIETPPLLLADTPDEWFDKAVAVNTKGVFLTCKHAIRHMLELGGGSICCTSSIHDVASYPMIGVYAISKAAVGATVRAIAADYSTRNIRANAILPGATLTPMVKREVEDAEDPVLQQKLMDGLQAMKRCADPSEIAAAAAFLLSDDASFITGASLPVDGGSLSLLPGPDLLDPDLHHSEA